MCALASHTLPRVIVSCSDAGVTVHASAGYSRGKFQVIYNGTDLSQFKPDTSNRAAVRQELGVSARTPLIGMIARFHPQKDHATFFAAAGKLIRTHPDVRFVLAGLGLDPNNPEITALMRASGVAEHSFLLGLRSDIPRILNALDVHTLSSSFGEGFPNVIGEAMASGVPCVVTDVGDSAQIVGDSGKAVPPRNAGALAQAWREMLDLPASGVSRLSAHARERVARHFSLQSSVEQYANLYERLGRKR
jgi:glycosyltransferase involved in cell wall biosynthesis